MRLRVPLPLKVLLSYLLVLGTLAIPAYWFLFSQLPTHFSKSTYDTLLQEVQGLVISSSLDSKSLDMQRASSVRLLVLDAQGRVDFDSTQQSKIKSTDFVKRSEVLAAKGDTKQRAHQARRGDVFSSAFLLPDKRIVYVQKDSAPDFAFLKKSQTYFRNALSVALSIALLLTLLSAYALWRPLLRLRQHALEMAAGDLNPSMPRDRGDEIADAHVALHTMSRELRKRLVTAGTGEAMLVQLVESLNSPIVIFALNDKLDAQNVNDGPELFDRVIAVNGLARETFSIEGPTARSRMLQAFDDEAFGRRLFRAEEDGVPKGMTLSFSDDQVPCTVFVLKRPSAVPLFVLMGEQSESTSLHLPDPKQVSPISSELFFEKALQDKNGFVLPRKWPNASIADADDVLQNAMALVLENMRQHERDIDVFVEVKKNLVGIHLDAALDEDVAKSVRPVIEPMGGRLEFKEGEAKFWLPRA